MDAVTANTTSGNNDFIAGTSAFFMARLAVNLTRDKTDCADKDQRFADKAIIESDKTLRGRDAGLIAARFHAVNDTLHNGFG